MPASDPHVLFLLHLPRVEAHARFALRHVRCPDTRADLEAEVVALAWRSFVRLVRRQKSPETFVMTLALRCSQAVRAGRRLARSDSARDVLSPVAGARHRFAVAHLGHAELPADFADAFAGSTRGRVPERVAFRIDFPQWRGAFPRRTRAILDALAAGGRTGEVAARFRLSPARVSQLRLEFHDSWHAFHGGG
jgi:hypothetical protein